MASAKRDLEHSLPFAMDPVVYDFAINERGTCAELLRGRDAMMAPAYYAMRVPEWLRRDPRGLSPLRRQELERFGAACRTSPAMAGTIEALFDRLLPRGRGGDGDTSSLAAMLRENGFDQEQHERVRADLKRGLIGLAQNRLPASTAIEDVAPEDVSDALGELSERYRRLGEQALASGALAVVTLAAGAGSRWTQGAGVVKALHPFCRFAGRHRTFLEVHLAKGRRTA